MIENGACHLPPIFFRLIIQYRNLCLSLIDKSLLNGAFKSPFQELWLVLVRDRNNDRRGPELIAGGFQTLEFSQSESLRFPDRGAKRQALHSLYGLFDSRFIQAKEGFHATEKLLLLDQGHLPAM